MTLTVTEAQISGKTAFNPEEAAFYEKEMAQCAAVHKRLRELLLQQRERFRNYLIVLDRQQFSIESANAEDLVAHVDTEERIVAGISALQNVIAPLENMYHDFMQGDIHVIKADVEDLRQQAVARSSRNREFLAVRMAEIRREIDILRNSPIAAGGRRSVFSNYNTASFVNING